MSQYDWLKCSHMTKVFWLPNETDYPYCGFVAPNMLIRSIWRHKFAVYVITYTQSPYPARIGVLTNVHKCGIGHRREDIF